MNPMIESLLSNIKTDIITVRRHLHQYPELSNEEFNTSQFVKAKLEEYGIPYESGYANTGVLGIIEGTHPGKTVALRADMDALPIQEMNTHDFVSKKENVMHACGHDAHTSMLLGAAYILNQMKENIFGTVLLIFQPAEENSPIGGSQVMMDDGVFENYTPDVIYGQHVWPQLPVGTLGISDGRMMGASDRFKITITGNGGHASMPHQTTDAVIIAAQLITNLQTIVSRNIDPLQASVVTVGKINGGYAYNVIADHIELEGTIRSYDVDVKRRIKERFFTIVNHVAETFEGDASIEYKDGYPPTINTPKWANNARKSARKVFGEEATPEVNPSLGGEDFGRFLEQYPGAFIWLGTMIEDQENQKPLHDSRFKLNEQALPLGTAFLAQAAIDTLEELKVEK